MIPELGKYAGAVLSSYGVTILLLIALAWASFARSRKVRKRLADIEARMTRNG